VTSAFTLHLARHLRTVPQAAGLLDHLQYAEVLARAADRTIVPGAAVGPALVAAAAESQQLVSSTLLRAEQTARVIQLALGSRCPPVDRWPELVEAGQSALAWPGARLTEGVWSAVSRLAWAVRVRGDGESRAATEDRARRVVDRFEALAAPGVALTVIAHGCFNVVLGRELRRRGWRGPLVPDVRPAHFTTYRLTVASSRRPLVDKP